MVANSTDRFNGVVASLAIKAPCVVATNANITLSGEQTVNGIAVVSGDRVLVKDQTDATENGIYCVSTGAWERTADFDGNRDVTELTVVNAGRDGASPIMWYVDGTAPYTIGTSNITFSQLFDPDAVGATITPTPAADEIAYFSSATAIEGSPQFTYDGTQLLLGTVAIQRETASAVNPVFCPNFADADTGIGWNGADQLSLIAGGVEIIRLFEGSIDYALINGEIRMQNNFIRDARLYGYSVNVDSDTPTGTTVTVDPTVANAHEIDLESASGNVTVTLDDGPASAYTQMSIKVQQDGSIARTVTFSATGTIRHAGGSAHPMNTTLDGFTIWTAETWNGTDWWMSGADYS